MASNRSWAPYVSVAQRRANANREASKLAKKGQSLRPIQIKSRVIATTFWGSAWCKNLENYADWANRMPRGRTYARNGSIVDLQIETGSITALVSGSSLYKIKISIKPIDKKRWQAIRGDCARRVSSLLDLMRGSLPDVVLARLTDPKQGMFPSPKELKLQCSCPDYATMCKHVAATLYGVGHLLDSEPGLFFKMRGVEQSDLVSDAMTTQTAADAMGLNQQSDFAGEDLSAIFGVDFATTSEVKSGSRFEESKLTNKLAGNAKSKVSTIRESAPQKKNETPASAKKAPAKKASAKKASAKKASAKKAPVKKAPVKKAPAKKVGIKSTLTLARASKNSKVIKADLTKKTTASKKRINKESPNKETTTQMPQAKPAKRFAQPRIVGATIKRVAAIAKPGNARAKNAK